LKAVNLRTKYETKNEGDFALGRPYEAQGSGVCEVISSAHLPWRFVRSVREG